MKRRTYLKLKQLAVITCVWVPLGFLIALYDYLAYQTQFSLGPTSNYSFLFTASINTGSAFIGALLGGSFLVFFVNVKYQDKPYGYTVLMVSLSFILIIAFITLIIGIISSSLEINSENSILFDIPRTIKNTIVWAFVVGLTQLFLQMNSKFGHGVFWNILRGKYNTPKDENRIFMSLDINSSTAIAEKLGDEKYHQLLKDFFSDITNPVLDNKGEIYQYVGDEVIVAWKYDDGIVDNQCIKCFFDMKENLERKKEKYLSRYEIVPSFKAGIHWGKVIVGEIGIIKRDITYSGDVMNTTSRIRNKCREFNVEVIASAELLDALRMSENYLTRPLGAIKLRGKEKEVLLSTFIPKLPVPSIESEHSLNGNNVKVTA
ncbi:MAG: adenylate/guanylate cyclase domain-containing protein [Ignavibacteriales bacterium]